ncbi:MAG: NAD(P)-dependent oxidoreductase [Chloroflexota bacterium]
MSTQTANPTTQESISYSKNVLLEQEVYRVLICDPIHPDGIALLQQHAHVDVIEGDALTTAALETTITDYHVVVNRSRTSIPASVIERGEHLQLIARAGAGLDNIDVAAAKATGVTVLNAPDAATTAVAEHTMALILGTARHVNSADQSMKAGQWERKQFVGMELSGATLGIVGFGRIGREVTKRARAFGMDVLVNQNRMTPELAQEWNVERVDLLDLLRRSDFISLHLPLRPSTENIINAEALSLMKPTAFLINTSRGGIVDEDALLAALDNGQIAGAGLDVFVNEPHVLSPLTSHPKVLATPHVGASTLNSQRNVSMHIAEQIIAHINSKPKRVAESLSLRVVRTESVFPHERYNALRVQRLSRQLQADNLLANPPLVAQVKDSSQEKYIVLDGATRSTAFKQLNYPHLVVQIVDMEREQATLDTWYHAVRGPNVDEFFRLVHSIPDLHITEMPVSQLPEAMAQKKALCYFITASTPSTQREDKHGYLVEFHANGAQKDIENDIEDSNTIDSSGYHQLQPLADFVERYGEWGDVERTVATDVEELQSVYDDLVALVIFPAFQPDMVIDIANKGYMMPAGVTRFVIQNRVLRLNAPLDILANDQSLKAKRDWFDQLIQEKLSGRQVRYYEESVILLDE